MVSVTWDGAGAAYAYARSSPSEGQVYLVVIPLLTLVLPVLSIVAERIASPAQLDLVWLIGKWFTFWGLGVRLFTAGLSQIFRPGVTSQTILGLPNSSMDIIVRELGFANVAMGVIGMASLVAPDWLAPAALAGGLFLGLAGAGHVTKPKRNTRENVALVTDFIVFAAVALFLISRALSHAGGA
jgi:hypothetical protein